MASLKRSAIPLYTQIASSLRNEIDTGTWPLGTKMPSINQLSERFGVAAQTMRQAIGLLEDEGLVLRRQGYGTVVQNHPRDLHWLKLPTDWHSLIGMLDELDVHVNLVDASRRMPEFREGDGRPLGAYKYTRRIHSRNSEPFCVNDIYLAAEIYLRAPKTFRKTMIIQTLAKMKDIEICKVQQSISIDVADAETAKHLDIPLANPVARVRRSISDKQGNAIYIAEALYRSDVIHLDMDLSPGKRSTSAVNT